MITTGLKISFFTRVLLVATKMALVLIMLFSIVTLFFVGSGIVKPESPWAIITKEGIIK